MRLNVEDLRVVLEYLDSEKPGTLTLDLFMTGEKLEMENGEVEITIFDDSLSSMPKVKDVKRLRRIRKGV